VVGRRLDDDAVGYLRDAAAAALTSTVKELVAAVVGVPERFRVFVVLDGVAVIPAGRLPETMDHAYGVQPPLAWMIAEYAAPTEPLGRDFVEIETTEPKHRVTNKSRQGGE